MIYYQFLIHLFFSDLESFSGDHISSSLPRLDADFKISDYMKNVGLTYKLRPQKTKNAELLLQQMFEDELDEQDFGPEFDDNVEDLEEVMSNNEDNDPIPRKITLQTIDYV